jgi:hypothetical protein
MKRILLIAVVAVAAGAAALGFLAPRPDVGAGLVCAATTAAPPAVTLVRITRAFDLPRYVGAPPGDTSRLFVVEKTGRIRIVKDGAVNAQPFLSRSGVASGGEQGLLSMAFDPPLCV